MNLPRILKTASVWLLVFSSTIERCCDAFVIPPKRMFGPQFLARPSTSLKVSELHVPGYAESKLPFILTDDDLQDVESSSADGGLVTLRRIQERVYTPQDFESMIPHGDGFLLHRTRDAIFSSQECKCIIEEAERVALEIEWTTNRHGNYPTTDLPLVELPQTLKFLRLALVERIYPLLRSQFGIYLPDPTRLRLADGFVVKYDAEKGQKELKPHRDGSVLSFNIALNPAGEYEGGGTWFDSIDDAIKIEEGQIVSHASALLHGGHGIVSGKRYILVGFVILEDYAPFSMRFYNEVRNL